MNRWMRRIQLYKTFLEYIKSVLLYRNNYLLTEIFEFVYPPVQLDIGEIKKYWEEFVNCTKRTNLDFYLHIPFCYDKCSYCICNSEKLNSYEEIEQYVSETIKYLSFFRRTFSGIQFGNLYVGGGTPSLLKDKDMRRLFKRIFSDFQFNESTEKTCELNPINTTKSKLKILRDFNFNRVSFGVQSLDRNVLRLNNRGYQNYQIVKRALVEAQRAGFRHINADLLMGLYGDRSDSLIDSFDKLTRLKLSSISLYPLQATVSYLKRFYNASETSFFDASRNVIDDSLDKICKIAGKNGYTCPDISLKNMRQASPWKFCLKDVALIKNRYSFDSWENNSVFGVGAGSHSYVFAKARYRIFRRSEGGEKLNIKGIRFDYRKEMIHYILRVLAHDKEVDLLRFQQCFGRSLLREFKGAISFLKKLNLVIIKGHKFIFLPTGTKKRFLYSLSFFNVYDIANSMKKSRIEEKINKGTERVDMKIGFGCNNHCKFCVQGDKRNYCAAKSKKEIVYSLREAYGEGKTEVVFTGGEPCLHPQILELIVAARKIGFEEVQIQSNGRMFCYMNFCLKAVQAGANQFALAVHGHNAKVHDSLTCAEGSFDQVTQGIRNLRQLGQYVLTNTVVTTTNARYLPQLAKLLVALDVGQFQFAFIHLGGTAFKNREWITPKKSEIARYIKKGLDIGIKAGKRVMTEAIPYCLMQGYEDYIAEKNIPHTSVYDAGFSVKDYTKYRQSKGKAKGPNCYKCKYDSVCEGPWKEYPDLFGWDEFQPVK